MEGLADYVRRVRSEKGFTLLDVQRNSHNQIAGSYVSRIENGIADAEGVTPKKLQALAKGLGVPEDEIFAVARGKSETNGLSFEELRVLEFYRRLPPERRPDVLAYLEVLDKMHGSTDASSEPAPNQLKRVWAPVVKGSPIDPKWAAAQEAKAAENKSDSPKRKAK